MSLIPCDYCHRRVPEKLCQATWAWYMANSVRVAYRQRLCTQCYCTNLLPLDKPTDFDALTCPGCGCSTEHDMDPVYATVYVPGAGRQQFEFPTCAVCAVEIRVRAQQGSALLEERRGVEGPGSSPSTPPVHSDYWSALAINRNTDAP